MRTERFGTFDVAIAGAGLAGASLALRLARRGMHVALLDSATFPRDKVCGEYLSPESWGVLNRLGLAYEVVRADYHPIYRVCISTPGGRVLEAEVAGPDGLPGIGLSRSVLDELIVRRARAAGAEVVERARVVGPAVGDGRVVGLRARHPARGVFEVRAPVVIAASGRNAALVRATGRTKVRGRSRPRLLGLKRHLRIADPDAEPAGTVGLHLVPGGYGGTCRVEGPLTNLCALVPEAEVRRRRGDLDRVAHDYLGRNPVLARACEAAVPSGEWKTVADVRVEASAPRMPGILYVGDCQGTVDPLGGQGMTMALLGAEDLAPFVAQALAASSGADARLQRGWQAAWHHRFDRRVRLCRLFHLALVNPAVLDLAATLGALAPRLLAACIRQTRDPEWISG
jgi:flavin-dependent dehydrogenase